MKYLLEETRGGWRCLRSMSMSANRRDGVPVVRIQNEVGKAKTGCRSGNTAAFQIRPILKTAITGEVSQSADFTVSRYC